MSALDSLFDQFDQEEIQSRAPPEQKVSAPKTDQPEEKYTKSMIFVRGIPRNATNEQLEEFFSDIGPVRSCFVVAEKNEAPAEGEEKEASAKKSAPVLNRGFGFVQYVLAEDAARAIKELGDKKFRNERQLMLDFAMKKQTRDSSDSKPAAKRPRTPAREKSEKPRGQEQETEKEQAVDHKAKKAKLSSPVIVIEGIPVGVTKHQLFKKIKKSGNPVSLVYPAPVNGEEESTLKDGAGGSAFITYDDHNKAQTALKALNNHIFKGAKLTAVFKGEFINKRARLIVRNLSFKLREHNLEELFSECGTVLEIDLPRKFTGGPLRGFAFVQMGDYASAAEAIQKFNGHNLQGRKISVALAIAKDKFAEMQQNGEIEKPTFEDEDVNMASDDDHGEGNSDDEDDVDDEAEAESDGDGDIKMASDSEGRDEFLSAEEGDSDAEGSEEDEDDDDVVDENLQEGCTLFIRNLSFDSDEDGLFDLFRVFGKLRYTRVVYDQETGRSRGTAFVCFWKADDAAKCLAAAAKAKELSEKLGAASAPVLKDQRTKSVLLQETPGGLEETAQFTLDGRLLSVSKAVDRNTAHDLATKGLAKRKGKDKRNAYLLKEGVVFAETPAAALMAPADLEHHIKEYGVRKNQILKNPNLYMSKTRLTVHNIPRLVDESAMRSAAMSAIDKFKHEVKSGVRKPLSADEMAEGWDKRPHITQVKIVRSTDRVEASTGKSRSMGYGFIEFSTHAHALACLRYLNFRNTRELFSKLPQEDKESEDVRDKSGHAISRSSLRVMFAIENAQIIRKRELRSTLTAKRLAEKAEQSVEDSTSTQTASYAGAKGKKAGADAKDKSKDKGKSKGKGKDSYGPKTKTNVNSKGKGNANGKRSAPRKAFVEKPQKGNRSKETQGNRNKRH
ncbi:RNA recognition motif-containing protein [Coemansia sp. Benny D115]|nr:RNA recognition motif-containing protein [Coemansia sp. Benny D115]